MRWRLNQSLLFCLRTALLVLLCLASAAHAAVLDVMTPGLAGEVRTDDDTPLALRGMILSTPRDLAAVQPGSGAANFRAARKLDFNTIRQISLRELPLAWQGSRPDAVESYYLGAAANPAPPPPDWRRALNQIPPWAQAIPAGDAADLPYLNHSIFCWAPHPADALPNTPGVYLFRQNFPQDAQQPLARATLRIATNARVMEVAFNEQPLNLLGASAPWRMAEYDVTQVLKNGANIVAVRVEESADQPDTHYGVAFHLEIYRRPVAALTPPNDVGAALLTTEDGERVWGRMVAVHPDFMTLGTPYGRNDWPWSLTRSLVLAGGLSAAAQMPELKNNNHAQQGAQFLMAAAGLPPTRVWPRADATMIALADRTSAARPDALTATGLHAVAADGAAYEIPAAQLRGIYPRQELGEQYARPSSVEAQLYCEVLTNRGERLHGLLRELNGRRVAIDPPSRSAATLSIKSDWIAALTFPLHGLALKQPGREQRLGILPRLPGNDRAAADYEAATHEVVAAAFKLGLTPEMLPLERSADQSALTPERYPLLVCPDATGEYLKTFGAPGDAQAALLAYVQNGGRLIVQARGGAFRAEVTRTPENQFVRSLPQDGIGQTLGYKIIRPATANVAPDAVQQSVDAAGAAQQLPQAIQNQQWSNALNNAIPSSEDATPFDHPPNQGELLYFERGAGATGPLALLPKRQLLQSIEQPLFYPTLPPPGAQIVYALTSSAGTAYGPALSIAQHGRGQIAVIDALLWDCPADGQPFCRQLLPILIAAALQ